MTTPKFHEIPIRHHSIAKKIGKRLNIYCQSHSYRKKKYVEKFVRGKLVRHAFFYIGPTKQIDNSNLRKPMK